MALTGCYVPVAKTYWVPRSQLFNWGLRTYRRKVEFLVAKAAARWLGGYTKTAGKQAVESCSGDLAAIDAKGNITIADRKNDMNKTGGENGISCEVKK